MHSAKLGKPTTQFDQLLFLAARNFINAAGSEQSDLSGEYSALDATAAGALWDDPQYEDEVRELLLDDESEPVEMTRGVMYQHYALIMKHLRRKGHLDNAPTPVDKGAEDFLSE